MELRAEGMMFAIGPGPAALPKNDASGMVTTMQVLLPDINSSISGPKWLFTIPSGRVYSDSLSVLPDSL